MVIPSLKRLVFTLSLALFVIGLRECRAWAEPPTPTENEVKAAYLYNFSKFIEWPSTVTVSGNFCIDILGDDPFEEGLEGVLAGKTVQDKPVVVRHSATVEDAMECQVVFVNLKPARLNDALEKLSHKPILTVGDRPGFLRGGGIIGFERVENTVRFNVNLTAAEKARLKMSSQLLKVAHQIRGAPAPAGTP